MAALSYYFNWDTFQQLDYSDINSDDPELLPLQDAAANNYFVDPYNEFSYSQNFNYDDVVHGDADAALLHQFNEPPFFLPHQEEFEPKRQRVCDSDEVIYSSFFNGFAPNPCLPMLQDYPPPEIVMPPPPMSTTVFPAADFCIGSSTNMYEGVKREAATSGDQTLSPQSVAARQRRRRITEKTQELGKLIPGGQKMNTAEMLQSAYKYIKFLQAQFALLEFVASNADMEAPFEGEEELQILLESPLIQEKLYSTEHCLVPSKFVKEVGGGGGGDEILKSNSSLEKEQ